jgi:hypothetical protein
MRVDKKKHFGTVLGLKAEQVLKKFEKVAFRTALISARALRKTLINPVLIAFP